MNYLLNLINKSIKKLLQLLHVWFSLNAYLTFHQCDTRSHMKMKDGFKSNITITRARNCGWLQCWS